MLTIRSPRGINPKLIRHFVKHAYGLEILEEPILMQGSTINAGWKIVTSSGNFILKIFSLPLDEGRSISEELEIYQRLRQANIKTPQVIQNINMNLISTVTIWSTEIELPAILMKLEILRRVKSSNITPEEIQNIANAIAVMHRELAKCSQLLHIDDLMLPKGLHTPGDPITDLQSPNGSEFSSKQISHIKSLDKKLAEYVKNSYKNKTSKISVLHGDLSLGHIQFLDDGSTYIFDFSDYTKGPVTWDLATLFVYFFKDGGIKFSDWKSICARFLFEYNNVINLTTEDLLDIQPLIADRLLFEIRTLNRLSRIENRPVDKEGNLNRYNLTEYIVKEPLLLQ